MDYKLLKSLRFEETALSSPTGGLFNIYINKEQNIIYKEIKKHIKIKDIIEYKKIIYSINSNQILKKYTFDAECIYIENDGSYYSKYIKNYIRLYDIKITSCIDYNVLKTIKSSLLELKNDLNEYVKKLILKGDWALHNLLFCLDTHNIYNIDLEGFYTYPLIYDNGNCNIVHCNDRFEKLLAVIDILIVKYNE